VEDYRKLLGKFIPQLLPADDSEKLAASEAAAEQREAALAAREAALAELAAELAEARGSDCRGAPEQH
jgi:hypothetical protein